MSNLTCQLCGYQHPTMISPSHLKKHGITAAEYKAKFPGAVLRVQTPEAKLKMATSKKGREPWNKGIKTGQNNKIAEAKKGKPNIKLRGRSLTEETKERISASVKQALRDGLSAETKTKIREAIKARVTSPGFVASMKGKSHSAESKAKIAAASKTRSAEKRELLFQDLAAKALRNQISIESISDAYWLNMRCLKCDSTFTFTRQVFLPSTRDGKDLCPTCHPREIVRSQLEINFYQEVLKIAPDAIPNDRKTLGGKEIDVLIPSKAIGFEITGLYWHAEKQNPEKKHLLWKKQHAANKGITLITIYEDELINKTDLVMSRVKAILGALTTKIHARKCEIREVSTSEKNNFLEHNHLQGRDTSSISLGLCSGNTLVSLATFKKTNMVKGGKGKEWELSRLCSLANVSVVGGASRLIQHFMTQYNTERLPLISYADSRWSSGDLYRSIGFAFGGSTPPSYWYLIKYQKRVHRSSFMKHKLVKTEADKQLTEWQLAQREGLDRIWDCGTTKWVLNP